MPIKITEGKSLSCGILVVMNSNVLYARIKENMTVKRCVYGGWGNLTQFITHCNSVITISLLQWLETMHLCLLSLHLCPKTWVKAMQE